MKRYIYLLGIFLILVPGACEKMLDREAQLSLTSDLANTLYTYTQNKAYALYTTLPSGFLQINGAMMASAVDEAEHTLETSNIQKFNTGAWNAVDNPDNAWNTYFIGIRRANIFLETADNTDLDRYKLDPNPARQAEYQTRKANIKSWKYEARFLRAFFYFELVKRYGGVPIITESLALTDDFKSIQRSSLEECIRFITDECDSAAANLVVTYPTAELGRATKGAALALKSRVLLYAASDLWNTPGWASGYSDPDMISLPTGDRIARWQAAANAAKAMIDLPSTGYGIWTDYVTLFKSFQRNEQILVRRAASTNSFEIANYPIGYYQGNSGTTPSQNLVDDYEVKVNATTAVPFDWNNAAHAADPFANRDPRLAGTVLLNNRTFKGRPVEAFVGGLDGPGTTLASKTGHYLYKYIDPDLNLLTGQTSVHSWVLIRLGEVYLNYAEALNEAQPGHADIKIYVDRVRTRTGVGMPPVPAGLTQAQMREVIRHERRVELAFEDHRAWDVRRWMLGETYFNVPLRGLEITKTSDNPATFSYRVINVEDRVFEPKMYFYPIPQTELNIATGWIQNPGWATGL